MSQELFDYERIRQWAESQEQGAIVGTSCTANACPLAQYLYDLTNKCWFVGLSRVRPAGGTRLDRLDNAAWVSDIIEQVDEMAGGVIQTITREMFLEVLDRVKPE